MEDITTPDEASVGGVAAGRPVGHDGTRVVIDERTAWTMNGGLALLLGVAIFGLSVWGTIVAAVAAEAGEEVSAILGLGIVVGWLVAIVIFSSLTNVALDLLFIGVDKQRNQDPGLRQTFAGIAHFIDLPSHIQTAFGGHFLTLFRHQAAEMGLSLAGNGQHLFRDRHLQIHAGIQCLTQDAHITVSNVAAIFT